MGRAPADTGVLAFLRSGGLSAFSLLALACVRSALLPRLMAATRGCACLSLTASNSFSTIGSMATKSQMLSLQRGTGAQSLAKLQLTKCNVVDWGGASAPDQRLSGLARERSERTQCQT